MRGLLMFAVLVAAVGCEESKPTQPASKKADEPKSPPKPPPKPKGDHPKNEPEPAPPKTFEDAWAEALAESKRLDAEEPMQTEATMKLLTAFEAGDARLLMQSGLNFKSKPGLRKLGFTAWLNRQSRAVASGDATFLTIAPIVWKRLPNGPGVLLRMMNNWAMMDDMDRGRVADHILSDTPASNMVPASRDNIIFLIGPEWFTAKK